jgi:hypothetical protein
MVSATKAIKLISPRAKATLFTTNVIMQNFIVASTNCVAILPIWRFYKKGHYGTAVVLLGATISSILYHLVERSKHNMPGTFLNDIFNEQLLLNIDRLFAVLSVTTILWQLKMHHIKLILPVGVTALLMQAISEVPNKFGYIIPTWLYMTTHCAWHILAFLSAHMAATIKESTIREALLMKN